MFSSLVQSRTTLHRANHAINFAQHKYSPSVWLPKSMLSYDLWPACWSQMCGGTQARWLGETAAEFTRTDTRKKIMIWHINFVRGQQFSFLFARMKNGTFSQVPLLCGQNFILTNRQMKQLHVSCNPPFLYLCVQGVTIQYLLCRLGCSVGPGEEAKARINFTPTHFGLRKLLVDFDSNKLCHVKGYRNVIIGK